MAAMNDAYGLSALGAFLQNFAQGKKEKRSEEAKQAEFEKTLAVKALEMQQAKEQQEYSRQLDAYKMLSDSKTTYGPLPNGQFGVTGVTQPADPQVMGQLPGPLGATFRNTFGGMRRNPAGQLETSAPPVQQGMMPTGAPVSPPILNPLGGTVTKKVPTGGSNGGTGVPKDFAKELGLYEENATMHETTAAELTSLRALNQNAYGGLAGAATTGFKSLTNTGSNDPKYKNTVNVVNGLKNLVSRVLKGTFGAQLSDSEREYLNSVYGAAERFSQEERDIAMARVEQMLSSKVVAQKDKVDSLGRTYSIEPKYKTRGVKSSAGNDPLGIR